MLYNPTSVATNYKQEKQGEAESMLEHKTLRIDNRIKTLKILKNNYDFSQKIFNEEENKLNLFLQRLILDYAEIGANIIQMTNRIIGKIPDNYDQLSLDKKDLIEEAFQEYKKAMNSYTLTDIFKIELTGKKHRGDQLAEIQDITLLSNLRIKFKGHEKKLYYSDEGFYKKNITGFFDAKSNESNPVFINIKKKGDRTLWTYLKRTVVPPQQGGMEMGMEMGMDGSPLNVPFHDIEGSAKDPPFDHVDESSEESEEDQWSGRATAPGEADAPGEGADAPGEGADAPGEGADALGEGGEDEQGGEGEDRSEELKVQDIYPLLFKQIPRFKINTPDITISLNDFKSIINAKSHQDVVDFFTEYKIFLENLGAHLIVYGLGNYNDIMNIILEEEIVGLLGTPASNEKITEFFSQHKLEDIQNSFKALFPNIPAGVDLNKNYLTNLLGTTQPNQCNIANNYISIYQLGEATPINLNDVDNEVGFFSPGGADAPGGADVPGGAMQEENEGGPPSGNDTSDYMVQFTIDVLFKYLIIKQVEKINIGVGEFKEIHPYLIKYFVNIQVDRLNKGLTLDEQDLHSNATVAGGVPTAVPTTPPRVPVPPARSPPTLQSDWLNASRNTIDLREPFEDVITLAMVRDIAQRVEDNFKTKSLIDGTTELPIDAGIQRFLKEEDITDENDMPTTYFKQQIRENCFGTLTTRELSQYVDILDVEDRYHYVKDQIRLMGYDISTKEHELNDRVDIIKATYDRQALDMLPKMVEQNIVSISKAGKFVKDQDLTGLIKKYLSTEEQDFTRDIVYAILSQDEDDYDENKILKMLKEMGYGGVGAKLTDPTSPGSPVVNQSLDATLDLSLEDQDSEPIDSIEKDNDNFKFLWDFIVIVARDEKILQQKRAERIIKNFIEYNKQMAQRSSSFTGGSKQNHKKSIKRKLKIKNNYTKKKK